MGCAKTLGRIILVLLNLVILVLSLALIATGAILKFFANKIIPYIGDFDSALDSNVKDKLGIPDLSKVTELPFVAEAGIALLAFGCVLFVISFCACCGACCEFRPLLIVFILLMTVLVIVQAVIGGLFLAKNSSLHKTIRKKLREQITDEYEDNKKDIFSFAINMLNYLLECCGINGPEDFKDPPLSCCKRDSIKIMSRDPTLDPKTCTYDPLTGNINKIGCYDKLVNKVLSQLTLAAVILGIILLLQVNHAQRQTSPNRLRLQRLDTEGNSRIVCNFTRNRGQVLEERSHFGLKRKV